MLNVGDRLLIYGSIRNGYREIPEADIYSWNCRNPKTAPCGCLLAEIIGEAAWDRGWVGQKAFRVRIQPDTPYSQAEFNITQKRLAEMQTYNHDRRPCAIDPRTKHKNGWVAVMKRQFSLCGCGCNGAF